MKTESHSGISKDLQKLEGFTRRQVLRGGLILVAATGLSGCDQILPKPTETKAPDVSPTQNIIPTEIADTPTIEVLPTETAQPIERGELTLEDIKNVEPSVKISQDEKGNFTSLPEGISPELKNQIIDECKAIQKEFIMADIYYSHDPKSENWITYAILGERMFYAANPDPGRENYPDFPLIFSQKADGTLEVSGQYGLVDASETIAVSWKNGLPQFLMDIYKATDGATYAKKYFDYQTKTDDDPWKKTSELFTLPKEAESTAPSELDLSPTFVESIDQKFMGVRINAELITSYAPVLEKVYIPENAYAEFIARTIFKVWWKKGDNPQTAPATETDFQNFMSLWANAQETNDPEDWKKVQLNNIWANDLKDGKGYVQKPYTIWPMFSGEAPEEVKGIDKISLAFVDTTKSKNISLATGINGSALGRGLGTNFEKSNLFLLCGMTYFTNYKLNYQRVDAIAGTINLTYQWLIINNSGSSEFGDEYRNGLNPELADFLIDNGLTVLP